MPCYVRPVIAAVAAVAVAAVLWTRASPSLPPALYILLACAVTLGILGWVALVVRADRARAGGCTRCPLSCQQPAVPPPPDRVMLPAWPDRPARSNPEG